MLLMSYVHAGRVSLDAEPGQAERFTLGMARFDPKGGIIRCNFAGAT